MFDVVFHFSHLHFRGPEFFKVMEYSYADSSNDHLRIRAEA